MYRRMLSLTAQARAELEHVRDRDKRAYMREYASALLKIADGASPFHVALFGLHKRRNPDTVYAWLDKYQEHGIGALVHKARGHRGFSPRRGRADHRDTPPGT